MSETSPSQREKARFNMRLEGAGQEYLGFAVWSTVKDPNAEFISVDVRQLEGDDWKTIGKPRIYRTADGKYRQLPPEREKPSV